MGIRDKIEEKAKELYKKRYGKRSPESLSSEELNRVNHDAAVQVQKEIRDRSERKS